MAPNSHPPEIPVSAHLRLLEISSRAKLFLTPDKQPHASLGDNTVPLYSAMFRSWLSDRFEYHGFFPSPAQYGAVLRKLDDDAHKGADTLQVHLRTALTTKPHHYRYDLANQDSEAIAINGKQWSIVPDLSCAFRRPQSSIKLPKPVKSKVPIHFFLMDLFHIKQEQVQTLANWLVAAMLPDLKPPILVIAGRSNQRSSQQNSIFNRPRHLSDSLAAKQQEPVGTIGDSQPCGSASGGFNINQKLQSIAKFVAHRPIIISALGPIAIDEKQINLEINKTSETELNAVLGALLNAVVNGIHEMTRREIEFPFKQQELLPAQPPLMTQVSAPYT